MAQAIKRLYPSVKFAIGPSVESGFYYDIDLDVSLVPEDLEKIEAEMLKIAEEGAEVKREVMSREKARELFAASGEVYKVEMIDEIEADTVSVYRQGEFFDLCRGPHVPDASYIKAFKLLSVAGAYWKGDEKNKMLQRIYGTAFPDRKELKKHLELIEEAKKTGSPKNRQRA